jgi:hypothetical protein
VGRECEAPAEQAVGHAPRARLLRRIAQLSRTACVTYYINFSFHHLRGDYPSAARARCANGLSAALEPRKLNTVDAR